MIACHFFRSLVRGEASLVPRKGVMGRGLAFPVPRRGAAVSGRTALLQALAFLVLGTVLMPLVSNGQSGYARPASYAGAGANGGPKGNRGMEANSGPGNTMNSNVPLNEINIHAFRHFRRLFPSGTSGEYWFKSETGYQVSFLLNAQRHQAYFSQQGTYLYSLKYYGGKEIPRSTGDLIQKKYPDYRIDVVTEITDGEKTFFLVRIINPSFVKTLSVSDGQIETKEELINGGGTGG